MKWLGQSGSCVSHQEPASPNQKGGKRNGSKKSSKEGTSEEGPGEASSVLLLIESEGESRRSVQVLCVRTDRVGRRDLWLRAEVRHHLLRHPDEKETITP
jgi:hypothetical protein